ncbi:MAG: hypothetical protein M3Q69_02430 [Acidobacteriota bacterium]|nr:hypothetical protein [Acidobacteriota bacterium]
MRHAVSFLMVLLVAGVASGADTDQKEHQLAVRHYAGVIELRNGAGDVIDAKRLQSDLRYDLRRTDSVRVGIEEANPLLFTYAWKDEQATDVSDFTAAKAFADAVKTLADLFGGLIPETKQSAITDVDNYCDTIAANRLAPADLRLCRAGVTPEVVAELTSRLDEIHKRAAEIPQLVKRSAVSWEDAKEVRARAVGDWANHEDLVKAVRAYYATLRKANRKRADRTGGAEPVQIASAGEVNVNPYGMTILLAQAKNPKGTGGSVPAPKKKDTIVTDTAAGPALSSEEAAFFRSEPLADEFQSLLNDETSAERDIAALDEFVKRARKIGEPVPLKTVNYNSKQQQPAVLTIKKIPMEGVDTTKYMEGEFKLLFLPGGPVTYDYGASAAYSFLEVPQFSVKIGDDTKLHIVRIDNGDEVSGATGVAMLTITPRPWNDPQFGAGFQLGISPVKDKIGVFLGARIRVFDLFTFGAGLAYQQTKRLADGVSLNDVVEAADKIKTTNVFKAAPYVSIGLEWPKK